MDSAGTRSRSVAVYPSRSAIARPISKWNSPCGSVATARYMSLTFVSSSCALTFVGMGVLLCRRDSEGKRRGAVPDLLVQHAGARDDGSLDQVILSVAACLH